MAAAPDVRPPVQCRSWAEAETHVTALQCRCAEVERRLRHVEKMLDTLGTAWWQRLWFRVDGFAPWYVVDPRRRWRPWHRDRWPWRRVRREG